MRLVIDTNMIIAALIKDSKAREIIILNKFEFYSPDFVLEEIRKYKDYICKKARMNQNEYDLLITLVFQYIEVISIEKYQKKLQEAKKIMIEDIKDVPYVACHLALKTEGIWTNDPNYKNLDDNITIFSTKDLLEILETEDSD